MNRPLWLNIVRVWFFGLLPPIVFASLIYVLAVKGLHLETIAAVLIYIGLCVIGFFIWIIILSFLARWKKRKE
jgi:hypothetical protein